MKHLLLAFGLLASVPALSQEVTDPKLTEIWEPEPKVVTPGLNGAPPSDALILFDGSSLDEWRSLKDGGPAKWALADGVFTVVKGTGDIITKREFTDFQLHIEFRTPAEVKGEGQHRGNSGVRLQARYEIQVLDSYNNRTYSNGQAGSVYKQTIPLVNASRKPGEWQTYDIIYTAPRFSEVGGLIQQGRVTVLHNGVLVQNNTVIQGPTGYLGPPVYRPHGPTGLSLQDHEDPVSFRNIWIREL